MKKKALIIIAILVILLIGALAVGINIYNNIVDNSEISKQEAIEIALDDANVKEQDANRIYAELNLDDGIAHYDVEFRSGDYEYNYDIDAKSGVILEKDIDRELF